VSASGDQGVAGNGGRCLASNGTKSDGNSGSFALIHGEPPKVGKSFIGFVNLALYAHPEVLNNITEGQNPVRSCLVSFFLAFIIDARLI